MLINYPRRLREAQRAPEFSKALRKAFRKVVVKPSAKSFAKPSAQLVVKPSAKPPGRNHRIVIGLEPPDKWIYRMQIYMHIN